MKSCNKCDSTSNPFGKDASKSDGLMIICKPCVNKRNRKYNKSTMGKLTNNAAKERWKKRNPKKYKAIRVVAKLNLDPLPCESCGSQHEVVWHHDDYDQPAQVRPLCCQCHRDWHVEHGEALNPK